MKQRKKAALFLAAILLLSQGATAAALEFKDFTDISGHWAEETMELGFKDGLVQGFEDKTLRPDAPISAAQMITILSRVLSFPESETALPVFPTDAWYAADAEKALSLGLISADNTDLNVPMTRQDALSMLAEAFCLVPAVFPLSSIEGFADYESINAENRAALAALVSEGYVQGFGGSLNVNSGISRGEFLTVLYRVAGNFTTADKLSSAKEGGTVISGGGAISNKTLYGDLWFDCTSESVSLFGVNAENITLLNPSLASLKIEKSSLDRLALSGLADEFELSKGSSVNSLLLDGPVKAACGNNIKSVELTGSGAELKLQGAHELLAISGNGNTVTLSADCSLERLVVTGSENQIFLSSGSSISLIDLAGEKNELSSTAGENAAASISISGQGNTLKITGAITGNTSVAGSGNMVSVSSSEALTEVKVSGSENWVVITCSEAADVSLEGSYSSLQLYPKAAISRLTLAGEGCVLGISSGSVTVLSVPGKDNSITLHSSAQSVVLDGRGNALSGEGHADSLTINAPGSSINVAVTTLVDNSFTKDAERVLSLVSSSYQGNFTLKWAQEHDYDDYDKEVFVNANGYESKTEYLIWVSRSMQRVNIFEGQKEDWKLSYSCIVATGAMKSPTPVGVYDTTYKTAAGWTTKTYTCRPVVGFNKGTGYAFHSRLFYPGSKILTDAQIGYPVSHGCVRMYDEDIRYIYDNIPLGTTVVVY